MALARGKLLAVLLLTLPLASLAQFRPIGAVQGSYVPTEPPPVQEPKTVEFDPQGLPTAEPAPASGATETQSSVSAPPVDAAAELSSALPPPQPPEPSNLWERIRAGFKLAPLDTPLTRRHERAFASQPEYLARIVERSRRYLFHIVQEVENRGMPSEIALLPIVESAFNPRAYSRAHASGIWQFIPETGRRHGLEQTWWRDERRDVLAATNAALDYLQMLYERFGSWELALAAYNGGEGRVSRALARNRALGMPTEYRYLALPVETQNYVPKLLAVRNIVLSPARFDLDLGYIPDAPYFSVVTTDKHIDLKRAAEFAEIPVDEFLALNPQYDRPVIAINGTFNILVPAETLDIFLAKLENPDQPLVSWRVHKLQRGESLEKVAYRFGMTASELREANGIPANRRVAGGGAILVPHDDKVPPPAEPINAVPMIPESALSAPGGSGATHRVQRGETLHSVAKRYGVTPGEIKTWNRLRRNSVRVGQVLIVHRAAGAAASPAAGATSTSTGQAQRHYVVRRGDTLSSIARRFNVSVADLAQSNNLSVKGGLRAGTRVSIPTRG